jgi:hypothetical protein
LAGTLPILTEIFSYFPYSLKTNAGSVPQIRLWPLHPSTPFQIHCLLSYSQSALCSLELLTESVNTRKLQIGNVYVKLLYLWTTIDYPWPVRLCSVDRHLMMAAGRECKRGSKYLYSQDTGFVAACSTCRRVARLLTTGIHILVDLYQALGTCHSYVGDILASENFVLWPSGL